MAGNKPESVTLINGVQTALIDYRDRGFAYGDGVFETIALKEGRLQYWDEHLARLRRGLSRLHIPFGNFEVLAAEARSLCHDRRSGVVKIVVTRGAGKRGYAPPQRTRATRLVGVYPAPADFAVTGEGITVCCCQTPLAVNPRLAGIKHLNRLEQVLARAEWTDAGVTEGLMQDTAGRVVSATAANLFVERNGHLLTPRLDRCGVAGVMRGVIMAHAENRGIAVQERDLRPGDIEQAEALFLTNSLIGMQPVVRMLDGNRALDFGISPLTKTLIQDLKRS